MRAFCTIITSNYIPYSLALYKSIIQFNSHEKLFILVVDNNNIVVDLNDYAGIEIIRYDSIHAYMQADYLFHKYNGQDMNALRWSLKPVLISYLLNKSFEKIIYVDCDIFFFNDFEFLFKELDRSNILLTPCWRTIDYEVNEKEFTALFTDGLYNAGFVAANTKGINALKWWAHACSYKTEINYEQGLFVDQKYLDALPVMFDNIGIVKHRGCNVAFWNQFECKRVLKDKNVLINGEYPIVFVHFTNMYIKELAGGNDYLIFPYYRKYESVFAEMGFTPKQFIQDCPEYIPPPALIRIKRKLLLRTRFKILLHKWINYI